MSPPTDFRDALYARYVSGFKCARGEASFEWLDRKYLPLLSGVARDVPVLELGCGDGGLLAYLQHRGFFTASGVDISAEQVELARARGVDAHVGDVFEYLATCEQTYGVIIAVDVLEHFSRDELLRLVPCIYSALQSGGRLLIQTANGAGLFAGQVAYGDLTHLTILTPESLSQLLRPVGFGEIRCYETGPVPIRIRGKLNVAVWSAVRQLASAVKLVETGKRQRIWTENFIAVAFKP